jgi:hypothetical protein
MTVKLSTQADFEYHAPFSYAVPNCSLHTSLLPIYIVHRYVPVPTTDSILPTYKI